MRGLLIAAIVMMPTLTMAEDLGPIDKAYEKFNNAARKMGSKSRMVLINCEAQKAKVCTHSMTGSLAAMSSSPLSDHSRSQDLTILFGKGSDPYSFIEAIGLSMIAWSPAADKSERGQAISVLASGIKTKEKREVVLGNFKYKLLVLDLAGLWFVVEPRS